MMRNRKEKEKKRKVISSAILNTNHTKNAEDGTLTFDLSSNVQDEFYPVGTSARFIYDVGNGYFTYLDESISAITGHYNNEIVFADTVELILQLVIDEHLVVVSELTQESFLFCRNHRNAESITLNLEYNIKTKTGEKKRILSQYAPVYFEEDGYPKINKGRIVDITHIKKDGAPLLYIIVDNEMVLLKQGNPEQMMKSNNVIFSKKEIEILRLISEGYTIKETASFLRCSIATVYTHRKNIRLKSNADINKSMNNLKERGII